MSLTHQELTDLWASDKYQTAHEVMRAIESIAHERGRQQGLAEAADLIRAAADAEGAKGEDHQKCKAWDMLSCVHLITDYAAKGPK